MGRNLRWLRIAFAVGLLSAIASTASAPPCWDHCNDYFTDASHAVWVNTKCYNGCYDEWCDINGQTTPYSVSYFAEHPGC